MRTQKNAEALSKDQKRQNWPNERLAKIVLTRFGINFEWQKPFYTKDKFICADFYLPDYNTVLEIDGCSHKKKKDRKRDNWLMLNFGIPTLRIKNIDLKTQPDKVFAILTQKYSEPR